MRGKGDNNGKLITPILYHKNSYVQGQAHSCDIE